MRHGLCSTLPSAYRQLSQPLSSHVSERLPRVINPALEERTGLQEASGVPSPSKPREELAPDTHLKVLPIL